MIVTLSLIQFVTRFKQYEKQAQIVKIFVAVKRVIDANIKVSAKLDGMGVDIANVKMSMNPFDEIAVEEAVRLRETGVATEVIAVSAGVPQRRKRCVRRWQSARTARS
jgi:hypothetical protein